MLSRLRELLARLTEVESRLIRVESRIVQLMNHMGIKPKGAIPDELRKQQKQKEKK